MWLSRRVATGNRRLTRTQPGAHRLEPSAMPDVCVIVPACEAEATLAACLRPLAEVGADVLVVDSASDRPHGRDRRRARRARARRSTTVPARPAPARAGLAATTASSSASPTPTASRRRAGSTRSRPRSPTTTSCRGASSPSARPARSTAPCTVPGPSPRFETANLGVRRELAERLGGFARLATGPAATEHPFGEDAIFGWRAVRAGARVGLGARRARPPRRLCPRPARLHRRAAPPALLSRARARAARDAQRAVPLAAHGGVRPRARGRRRCRASPAAVAAAGRCAVRPPTRLPAAATVQALGRCASTSRSSPPTPWAALRWSIGSLTARRVLALAV